MAALDPRPLWLQLADLIGERITRGEYEPGHLLTETGLEREHGLSRGTVRQAMAELRRRGLIETAPGKGSYVLPHEGA
jgi:GntR family transcriptional regulator